MRAAYAPPWRAPKQLVLLALLACCYCSCVQAARERIFFLDVLGLSERAPVATLCAVESAARLNPELDVVVYSNGWRADGIKGVISEPNVHVRPLNASESLRSVPEMAQWYGEEFIANDVNAATAMHDACQEDEDVTASAEGERDTCVNVAGMKKTPHV